MAGDTSEGTRQLDQTPTWAVASVCAIIIIISIGLEKLLHKLGKFFTEKHKKSMFEALEKVKAELMVLGFISLLLTFSQSYIVKICIPDSVADTMLPCPVRNKSQKDEKGGEVSHRLLLWQEQHGRSLAESSGSSCEAGKVPIITINGLHQLHILIFFLAVLHVVYSAVTMALGRLKIRGWKQWEGETSSNDYEFSNDPTRFRLTHETSFVKSHTSFWTRYYFFFYIGCFFRQFFRSVSKSDYLTVRNGFINVHLARGSKFNFQKYVKRSLEDDFQVVVGISPILWASFVLFLLLNVNGWQAMFWASLLPLVVIIAVGTKLQAILTKMALEITQRHAVVQGIPLVQASDKYFWFSKPHFILHLIHFALFQYEYKIGSCFHDNLNLVILKLVIGVGVLIMCSYITLPLYALVSQMGSNMKKSIFDEQTAKALKNWRMAAVKKKRGGGAGSVGGSSPRILGNVTSSPTAASSVTPLNRFKTFGHSPRSQGYEETPFSDLEAEPQSSATHTINVQVDHQNDSKTESSIPLQQYVKNNNTEDFSFDKPAPSSK
ncbi:seven transmembrane MLO family protein [Artemisia annua]|uniref:MLO-like protein n=1 Tax=Artemisia annua TaxID=35608 RepID=A0A2U1LQ87_ARTAN|nr:seven transmembrane MLO family protein [Artemisia annua]